MIANVRTYRFISKHVKDEQAQATSQTNPLHTVSQEQLRGVTGWIHNFHFIASINI